MTPFKPFAYLPFAILTASLGLGACAKIESEKSGPVLRGRYCRRDGSFTSYQQAVQVPLRSGETAAVKVYHFAGRGGRAHRVIYKYADLLNRAIAHKLSPQGKYDEVFVNFAIYKIGIRTFVGFNPLKPESYGLVGGSDFAGDDSEKLIYSLVKAAKKGVTVRMVYHNPSPDPRHPELDGIATTCPSRENPTSPGA